jgi:hypothetical protein
VNARCVMSDCLNYDTACTIKYEGKTDPNDAEAVANKTQSWGFLIFGRDYHSYSHVLQKVMSCGYYRSDCLWRAIHCTQVGIRPLLAHTACAICRLYYTEAVQGSGHHDT